jgi:hypothetical protein
MCEPPAPDKYYSFEIPSLGLVEWLKWQMLSSKSETLSSNSSIAKKNPK